MSHYFSNARSTRGNPLRGPGAVTGALAALVLCVSSGSASAEPDTGLYLGGGVGVYTLDIDDTSFDDNASVVKVLGGYRFGKHLAIEADYQKLFETEDDIFGAEAELEADAFTVAIRPILPLTDFLDVYGKVGYTYYEFDSRATFLGVEISEDDSDRDWSYGLGVDLNVTDNLSLRGEVTRLDIDDADLNLVSAAVLFRF